MSAQQPKNFYGPKADDSDCECEKCCLPTIVQERDEAMDEAARLRAELVKCAQANNDTVTAACETAAQMKRERDEAIRSRDFAKDWYGQRFQRLRKWIDEEVRPLSAAAATRYFSICANGTADPYEPSDWRDTIHGQTIRAEQAERERDALKKERFVCVGCKEPMRLCSGCAEMES